MTERRLPIPPEPYVVHAPMPATPFIDREEELRALTDWAGSSAPVVTILGLGGMGKTALAWEWFAHHANGFEGRLWWSFYDDADPARFLVHSCAYLEGVAPEQVDVPPQQLVGRLLDRLVRGRFLFVLDGFERQLVEYAPPSPFDAAAVPTSDRPRRAASALMAELLRRLVALDSGSKILFTSRLVPADLQDANGFMRTGVGVLELDTFDESGVRALMAIMEIADESGEFMKLAEAAHFHPLALRILAHQVATDPASLPEIRSRLDEGAVLDNALGRLDPSARMVAAHLARWSEPVHYETLAARVLGKGKELTRASELDQALTRLQQLGLMVWNREENTYSMHPLVRSAMLR